MLSENCLGNHAVNYDIFYTSLKHKILAERHPDLGPCSFSRKDELQRRICHFTTADVTF